MTYNSIVAAVVRHAEETPQKLCIADEAAEFTYKEFECFIGKLASALINRGVTAGSRVVVEARQRAEFAAIEFGLHLIGAVFVPVENKCTSERISSIATRCDACLIITEKKTDYAISCCTYAELVDEASGINQYSGRLPDERQISEILFSTGTTGKEKGIVLSHGSDVAVGENIMYGSEMKGDNVEMIPSPLNHSHGLRSFYANMLCGGTVILLDSVMDMRRFFGNMEKYKVNSMDLVPTALTVILKLSKEKLGEYKNQLRYIEFGSAPMMEADRETIKRLLPNSALLNYYGSTESGRVTVYNFNVGDTKKGCIGKPTHHVEMIIVNAKREVIKSSASNTGLLASKGKMNMLCYWVDHEETESVMQNGFVYSNDEAYFDEDGDIVLLGRMGDVINVGGKKVSPEEIENAVKGFPHILDCGCIGVKDEITGNTPKLFIQMEDGCVLDTKAVREFIAGKLEPFKMPKYIEITDKIPRSYNGKLLRRQLH